MHVPQAKNASPRKGRSADDPNRMEELKREIEELKNQLAKKSRDDLDAMYNIDADNLSPSLKRLFASWSDGDNTGMAEIKAEVDSVKSQITSITEWQSETGKNIASITQTATNNYASITQIVSAVGKNGEVTAATIAASISKDESLIQLIADKVEIEGTAEFVTKTNLTDGTTKISGNNIFMNMPLTDGEAEAQSYIRFLHDYISETYPGDTMAYIKTKNDGAGSEVDARHALMIHADEVFDGYAGGWCNVALKLSAKGAISMESYSAETGIYIAANGYATINAQVNTRIRANSTYKGMENLGMLGAENDYVFASDGIYYGKTKILDV